MPYEYKTVEGELFIHVNGKITLDGMPMYNDESITISIEKLKCIIKDAKAGVI